MPQWRAKGAGGKLKSVAARWASGRGGGKKQIEDDPFTDCAVWPEWMGKEKPDDDETQILAADADIVALFLALDTQWRRHPMAGSRLGLDYAAIKPTADLYEIKMSPAIMADLRVMELAALEAFFQAEKKR